LNEREKSEKDIELINLHILKLAYINSLDSFAPPQLNYNDHDDDEELFVKSLFYNFPINTSSTLSVCLFLFFCWGGLGSAECTAKC
jgi:hypothetical protein